MGKIESIDAYLTVPADATLFPNRRKGPQRQGGYPQHARQADVRSLPALRLVTSIRPSATLTTSMRLVPSTLSSPGRRKDLQKQRTRLLDTAYMGTALALATALWWTIL